MTEPQPKLSFRERRRQARAGKELVDDLIAQADRRRKERCPHGVSHLNICRKCD